MTENKIMYWILVPLFILSSIILIGEASAKTISGNGYSYTAPKGSKTFIYSGGCFWCSEYDSEKLDGVYEAISGFTGGTYKDPDYYKSRGFGDQIEGTLVVYDPKKLSYKDLVQHVYKTIDYEDADGQFCDRGHAYSPAIYFKTDEEKQIALDLAPETSVVPVVKENKFYPVRPAHQNFYKRNFATSLKYKYYRKSCGRDKRIEQLKLKNMKAFFKPSKERVDMNEKGFDLTHLNDMQYYVTQNNGTERAFTGPYYNNKEEGIYVDIVDGSPLYSSTDKFDSRTGWPSFSKSIKDGVLKTYDDHSIWWLPRRELRSSVADSHLGHIFYGEPTSPTLNAPGHKDHGKRPRHCINGNALKFIPKDKMEAEGYGKWLYLFEKDK